MNKQQIPAKLAAIIQANPVKSVSTGLDFAGFQYSGLFQICSRFFNMYYTLISSCNYLGSSISRAGLHKKTSVRTSYLRCSIFLLKIPEI